MTGARKLTESEQAALDLIKGGKIITPDDLPSANYEDHMGRIYPGARTWRKLEKLGLLVFPIEDPIELEDGTPFTFSSIAELTDAGERARQENSFDPSWPELVQQD